MSNQTTLSALQLHPWALIVADEDATAGTLFACCELGEVILKLITGMSSSELHVKTVKYFKSIERVQEEVERNQAALNGQVGSAD